MYKVVFNRTETYNGHCTEKEVHECPHQFRLKSKAVHYVREIVQINFIREGYETEAIAKGGLICFKSEITSKGNRTIEMIIEVKKA